MVVSSPHSDTSVRTPIISLSISNANGRPTHIDWLDGGMITLATYTTNILHPGILLGKGNTWKNEREVRANDAADIETLGRGSPDVQVGKD